MVVVGLPSTIIKTETIVAAELKKTHELLLGVLPWPDHT